jgi:hypothetical protein
MRAVSRLLLLCAALAAGCGGDDGGGDDGQEVREVVRLSLTADDPEGDCGERLSNSLIRRTYGTRARCVKTQREDEDDSADAVDFSRVQTTGDRGTAEFTVRGGETDGAKGGLELVREDGDWRIDEVSVSLLRSLIDAGLRSENRGDDLTPAAAECMARAMRGMPDSEFRKLAYAMIGETAEAQRRTFEILGECEGEGGVSLLRQVFEKGIVESLRKRRAGQAEIDCVVGRLRRAMPEEKLPELLSTPGANQALGRDLVPIITACQRTPRA